MPGTGEGDQMYVYCVTASHTEYGQRTEAGSHAPGEAARSHPGTGEAGVESEDSAHLGPSWNFPFGGTSRTFEFQFLHLQRRVSHGKFVIL